jgi:GTP-binding protein YchF
MIGVPDARLNELNKYQETEKVTPTTVEIIDIPGLARGSSKGEGIGNKFLGDIRNTDALIHVLRCFEDENLPHIDGSVDPVRDLESVNLELLMQDMESVVKRNEKLAKLAKGGDKTAQRGIEVIKDLLAHLESLRPAREFEVKPEDQSHIDELFLLTSKPVMYVCNVDEGSLSGNRYVDAVKEAISSSGPDESAEVLIIAAAAEAEIAELENEKDRMEFLAELGLEEPGVNKMIQSAYRLLNLRTFFTIGPKEIRAWTLRSGMTAPQAAGVIHSDLERGFIRAEVIKYDDFIHLGSESACRDAGTLRVEGKSYVVDDGDILHIRFNV